MRPAVPRSTPAEPDGAALADGQAERERPSHFPTVAQQANAFVEYLLNLSPAATRQASGVMSPTLWLSA
ncbi:MAG TPA: hypothetical protein VGW38_10190 [Chloroflexota bacterium]|nr:hypothetical protein [Chloroflexota bacterium]